MMTPLCVAASRGNTDSVKGCVELGADASIPADGYSNRHKVTALHYAAERNAEETCSYLVNVCRMNVNEQTSEGLTPLLMTKSEAITGMLLTHGAKVSHLVNADGNNLVRYNDDVPCIDLLKIYLAHGGKKIVNVCSGPIKTSPISRLCYTASKKTTKFESLFFNCLRRT